MKYNFSKNKNTFIVFLKDESNSILYTTYHSHYLFIILHSHFSIKHSLEFYYEFELENISINKLLEMLSSEDKVIIDMIINIIKNSKI